MSDVVPGPVAVGTELPELHVPAVSPEHMKTLAVLLDDPNEIHLDPAAVRRAGLGDRVINQGPANAGYLMDMLRAALPGARFRTFRVRFLANVLGGDSVRARGTVTDVARDGDGTVVTVALRLEVDGRGRAVDGTAVLSLPRSRGSA